jgi:hypothetical protein
MKIINRGFIILKPKKAYLDWANQFEEEEIIFSTEDECEASIYLIEEDFFDFEPVLEKNFKKIFKNELEAVADEEHWPENLTLNLFLEWFEVDFGTSVFDTQKNDLIAEKLD